MRTYLIFNTGNLTKKLNSYNVFYEVKENKNTLTITKKYRNHRGRPFSVTFPKEIKITPEAVGLIVGEGFISDRHFVFANSNEKAVDEVLEFLKQFNLPIKFYLEISSKEKSKVFINECLDYWQSHLGVKINRIRLRKEFFNITKKGTIHLIVSNSLFAKVLKQIVIKSKHKAERSKNLSIGYLKGIIAAEGNINVKKNTSCVYMVRISASKQEERNHYKRCLEKAGIKISCKDMPTISKQEAKEKGWKTTKGRAGAVIISKWENFIKVFELDLLEVNRDKKDKFVKYLINNKFAKQFFSFSHFLNKEFTMKQAQEYFKFKGRYLDRVLSLYKQGYLSRRKINEAKFAYKLTKKYLELFNKLNSNLQNPIHQ